MDNGCGMPQEVLEKALDPFFTTKPHGKGTGLGLPIVYGAVKAHSGQLELRSTPGVGTSVLIRLPACEIEGSARAVPQPSARPTRSLAVMVVDDDELVQTSVKRVLKSLGHVATIVPTGEEALDLLGSGYSPDVVILDLNMPGMGGAAALPRIREIRPEVPVLLATGRVDQQAMDLARQTDGVTLLAKPFSVQALNDLLMRLM